MISMQWCDMMWSILSKHENWFSCFGLVIIPANWPIVFDYKSPQFKPTWTIFQLLKFEMLNCPRTLYSRIVTVLVSFLFVFHNLISRTNLLILLRCQFNETNLSHIWFIDTILKNHQTSSNFVTCFMFCSVYSELYTCTIVYQIKPINKNRTPRCIQVAVHPIGPPSLAPEKRSNELTHGPPKNYKTNLQ